MNPTGMTRVTIADPGWTDKREVRVASIKASWRVNGVGGFSAVMPARTAWLNGIDSFNELYLRWDHPTLGIWGGIVGQVAFRMGETVELSCNSFVDGLAGIRTPEIYRQQSASAGTQAFRAITDVPGEFSLFDEIDCDDSGPLIATEWHGDDLFTIIDRIAKTTNQQYTDETADDWTRAFRFREQIGDDLSEDVLLVEGVHFGDGDLVVSTKTIFNDILAKSADADWQDEPGVYVEDGDSITTYRRKQTVKRYYGLHDVTALAARARQDLATLSSPQIPVSVRLRDAEPLLAEIRQGDTVRLWSWSANFRGFFTVTQRAVDVEAGTVTLTGTARVE